MRPSSSLLVPTISLVLCIRLDGIEIVVPRPLGWLHCELVSPQREDPLDGVGASGINLELVQLLVGEKQ
jgi:hypothetical protein